MNYEKIYNQIIDRAKARKLEGYKEKHHIIPKCMKGSNNKDNLAELTAKEHFICHRLLVEIYPNNKKLIFALWGMCNQNKDGNRYKVSSRSYSQARIKFSESIKGYKHPPRSEKSKLLLSIAKKGKTYKELYGDAGIKKAEAHAKAMSGRIHSEETKMKIGNSNRGRKRTEADKEKMRVPKSKSHRLALTGPKQRVTCPHCNKEGGINNMYRYHFNNCKNKNV
jgi:hypothetical protein